MAPASTTFIAVAMIAFAVHAATAKNVTVGAPGGSWDLSTNFASWAASQTFVVGDNLIFSYSTSQHNVLEVIKANYDSCSTGSPISTHASGNDVIPLPTATTRYFICGTVGHCSGGSAGGMKVAVAVAASSTAPSPPAVSSPPPSSPGSPPSSPPPSSPGSPPSPPPPPGKSGAGKATVGFGYGLGMLVLLTL